MNDHLRQIKPGMATDKLPAPERAALRALKAGKASAEQQQMAYRVIVHDICGILQIANAMPGEESVVNWRAGCRWPGLYIEAQILLPAEDDPPPEPPARTITEKVRRRNKSETD